MHSFRTPVIWLTIGVLLLLASFVLDSTDSAPAQDIASLLLLVTIMIFIGPALMLLVVATVWRLRARR